ncbi:MAG: Clp protease N-terminal domain-containing protein, partial [Anaerolineae bacterium]
MAQAHDEARRLKHNYLGTEHLLLGLIREQTAAALILMQMGVDLNEIRAMVERIAGRGEYTGTGTPTLTPRTQR